MVRFRTVLLILVAALVTVALAVALPVVRRHVRLEIEAHCARLVEGTCSVGEVHFGRDGLVAVALRARSALPELTVEVAVASVRLDWWRGLTGRPQDIELRIDGLATRDAVAPERVIDEFVRLRERHRDRTRVRNALFRVTSLRVDHASARAVLGDGLVLDLAGMSWVWRRGEIPDVEWADASVAHVDGTQVHTGHCSIRANVDDTSIMVECSGFGGAGDVQSLPPHAERLRELARYARNAAARARPTTPGRPLSDSPPPLAPVRLLLRAHDGSLRLARAEQVIVDMHPAAVDIVLDAQGLRSAVVRLGGETTGPALEFALSRDAPGAWRADVSADGLPLRELAAYLPVVPWHAPERGQASLRVHVEPTPSPDAFVVDGQIAIEDFGLMHPGLSHDPIDGLSVSIRGGARVDVARRRIETESVQVGLNGIVVAVAGWAERAPHDQLALDVSIRLPTMGCDAVRRALPRALTGPVDDLGFSGTIGADAHVALDTRHLAVMELQVDVDDQCVLAHDALTLGVHRLRGPFVQRVQEPNGLRAFVTGPGSAAWVPLARVSPFVRDAVLSREDGRFYRHHGFDLGEIRGAIVRNLSAHRFVYGASTLSMQLAKNVFLAREKTLVRKLQEVVLTWYLEHSLDKDSILELYLNVVEFGPGVYGIGPAARFFFGREAHDLTPLESIYLATLLPNPTARFASFQRGGVGVGTLAALRAYARRMAQQGSLSPAEAAFAEGESLVFRPASTPVNGALTQNVDPSTTDDMASQLSPVETSSDASAEPTAEDPEDSSPPDDEPARAPPVSVHTGGRL